MSNSGFTFRRVREEMIETLLEMGIKDFRVLDAMAQIPRHIFIDEALRSRAYENRSLTIGYQQTISQPYTVAFQTQMLKIKPYQKVLEIGTGSGYQAAVLNELNTNVYTIERQKDLFKKTKEFLPSIGYKCNFFYGDGYKGLEKFAPFDRIIITCGAPQIPKSLIDQLKIGGRMVAPIGNGDIQIMHLIEKLSETENKITTHGEFSFVPMLNDKQNGN